MRGPFCRHENDPTDYATVGAPPCPCTFDCPCRVAVCPRAAPVLWLTRDTDAEGNLEDAVDVWTVRPDRTPGPVHPVVWLTWLQTPDGSVARAWLDNHFCQISSAEARLRYRTIPETSRECVRVEYAETAART